MQKFSIDQWPITDAVQIKLGDGRVPVAVLADPCCPWCEGLFRENLPKLDNVVFYIFFTDVLGEDSKKIATAIYAASNPGLAWEEYVMNGKTPMASHTVAEQEKVDRNTRLFNELKLETVPAVFFEKGKGPFGFMTPEEFSEKIEKYC